MSLNVSVRTRDGVYARRLGVRGINVKRLGGWAKLKTMKPWARRLLVRAMLNETPRKDTQ